MIAFDPELTVAFEAAGVAGVTRYLTARQEQLAETQRQAYWEDGDVAHLLTALQVGHVSMTRPADKTLDDLADLLTALELHELVVAKLRAVALSEIDRKKSASPSASPTTDGSATTKSVPAATTI